MNSITQDIMFKQVVVEYSIKYGVTEAAKRYKQHRKTIYRWRAKYDGTKKSLVNKSRKPHRHPKEHSKEEIEMIKKYKAQNKETRVGSIMGKIKKEWIYKKYNEFV